MRKELEDKDYPLYYIRVIGDGSEVLVRLSVDGSEQISVLKRAGSGSFDTFQVPKHNGPLKTLFKVFRAFVWGSKVFKQMKRGNSISEPPDSNSKDFLK